MKETIKDWTPALFATSAQTLSCIGILNGLLTSCILLLTLLITYRNWRKKRDDRQDET